jgi:hypothetical protein
MDVKLRDRTRRLPTTRLAWRLVKMGGSAPADDTNEVPDDVIAAAKEAFGRRSESQVAILISDSLLDEDAPASDHRLRFEHPLVRIDLQVSAGPHKSRLRGRLEPPVAPRVQLEFDAGPVSRPAAVTDGTFLFERVHHGVTRLTLLGGDTLPTLHTDWFRV